MIVELIYDKGCPNVERARANLVEALATAGREARWTEWDRGSPESPPRVLGFGSPTILVDGKDVAGETAGEGSPSCRLYRNGAGRFHGVPLAEEIVAALRTSSDRKAEVLSASPGWRSSLAAVPRIGVAFLPTLVCPACWPAYAGLLSALGLGFLLNRGYLIAVTATFLTLAVGALAFHARKRRGYGPFAVGLAAAVTVLVGKVGIESNLVMYGGIAGVVAVSAWNAWPAGARVSCRTCRPESSLGITHVFRMRHKNIMAAKRKIEVFSAGCPVCEQTIALVNRVACPSCEVSVLDMRQDSVAKRTKELGIRSAPAVVIDGKLADCCAGRGPQGSALRAAGLGQPA